ncbi:MAG: hypothetical protein HRF49_05180 [bacterium]
MTTSAVKWILFPLALLAGIVVRLAPEIPMSFGGVQYSIWFDEVWTLLISKLPLKDALYFIHHFDANPPLSYLFLRLTPQLPDGEITRIVPGIFGILALAAFLWLGSRHLRRGEMWLAGSILAISPIHVWYALDLRYYSLMDFISITWFFLTVKLVSLGRELKNARGNRTNGTQQSVTVHLWLLFSALGMLTHNIFAATWLAGTLCLMFCLGRAFPALFNRPLQYLWIVAPLAYWARVFLWQAEFAFGYETTLPMPAFENFLSALNDFLLLFSMVPIWLGVIFVFGPIALLIWNALDKKRAGQLVPALVPVCIWIALFPPVLLFAASHVLGNAQLFSRRYMIPTAIAVLVAWALGAAEIKWKPVRVAFIAALAMFSLMGLYAVFYIQYPADWKSVADWLRPGTSSSRWVIVREADPNYVVSETSCLRAYLPEILPEGFRIFSISPEGASPLPMKVRSEVAKMSDEVRKTFARYYPPHYSFPEFNEILKEGNWTLPPEVYVAYIAAKPPPDPEIDLGEILGGSFRYEGSKRFAGIRVDLWQRKRS